MIEKFRDVTIEGREYRVGLVTADIGSWITTQMITGGSSNFETYKKIQAYLLNLCSVYKGEVRSPMRIFDNGIWLCPELDLEYDLDTVDRILDEAVKFNFDSFFAKRKAEAEKAKRERLTATQATSQ